MQDVRMRSFHLRLANVVHSRYQIAGTTYKGVEEANTEMEGFVKKFLWREHGFAFIPTCFTQNKRTIYISHLQLTGGGGENPMASLRALSFSLKLKNT